MLPLMLYQMHGLPGASVLLIALFSKIFIFMYKKNYSLLYDYQITFFSIY